MKRPTLVFSTATRDQTIAPSQADVATIGRLADPQQPLSNHETWRLGRQQDATPMGRARDLESLTLDALTSAHAMPEGGKRGDRMHEGRLYAAALDKLTSDMSARQRVALNAPTPASREHDLER